MSTARRVSTWLRVFGVATGLALFACHDSKDAALGHAAAAPTPPKLNVVPDQVDELTLVVKGGAPVLLARKNGLWFIEAPPPERPARADKVAELLANLAGMKSSERVAAQADDDLLASYELTPNNAIHVVAKSGGATSADVWLGKSGARGEMVRVQGDPGIWAMTGLSSYLYMRTPKDFAAGSPDQANGAAAARYRTMPTTLAKKIQAQAASDLTRGTVTPVLDVIKSEIGEPTATYAGVAATTSYVWGAQIGSSPTMDQIKTAPFAVRTMRNLTCGDYAGNMVEFYSAGERISP